MGTVPVPYSMNPEFYIEFLRNGISTYDSKVQSFNFSAVNKIPWGNFPDTEYFRTRL